MSYEYNSLVYGGIYRTGSIVRRRNQSGTESDFLAHYGIQGQKHGVRRFQNEDGSLTEAGKVRYGYYDRKDGTKDMKRLDKDAQKYASEYARAKAYYGEGAGNRRKKIKNEISERMKDPDFKSAFDKYMKEQDMSKHQAAANRERHVQDAKNSVGRTARGIKNLMLGVGGATISAVAIYNVAKMTGADQKIGQYARMGVNAIKNKMAGGTYGGYRWH